MLNMPAPPPDYC